MKLKRTVRVLGCSESYIVSNKDHGYKIMINRINENIAEDKNKLWYFVISSISSIFAYNSNLDRVMFESKKKCLEAAELKANECSEINYSTEYDNAHLLIRVSPHTRDFSHELGDTI